MSAVRHIQFVEGVHALRGLAALFVVGYHAGGALASGAYQGIALAAPLTSGLAAGVTLFFVVSGFVISLPVFQGRSRRITSYLIGRLLRIYPMSILTALICICAARSASGDWPSAEVLLSSLALLPNGADPVPIVLWTLKQELLFYALFALVFWRRLPAFVLLAVWGVASSLSSGQGALGDWLFNPHNSAFLFGILAAWGYSRTGKGSKRALAFSAAALLGFLALAYLLPETRARPLLVGLLGGGVVFAAALAPVTLPRVAAFLGDASYSIYLIHFLFISAANRVLIAAAPALDGVTAWAVLVTVSTLGGCGYYLVFERPLERWRRGAVVGAEASPGPRALPHDAAARGQLGR